MLTLGPGRGLPSWSFWQIFAAADDSTAGLDTPHGAYTQLRRNATETLFCAASRVASVVPDAAAGVPAAVVLAMRTGRVLRSGDRLVLRDRPRRVPASMLAGWQVL